MRLNARAKQLDYIGSKVPKEDRRDLISLIGGDIPYVFRAQGAQHFVLCNKGYQPISGVIFDCQQLERSGVVAWQERRGTHNGSSMFSVVHNLVLESSDSLVLRQAARLVGSIARIAESLSGYPRV